MGGAEISGPKDEFLPTVEQLSGARKGSLFFASLPTGRDNHRPEQVRISDDVLRAQDSERLRLGRELHDSTGQLLVALSLSVAHLRHLRDPGFPDGILGEIDDAVRQINQEIRTFSFINYPAELGKSDLVAALATFARGFSKRTGLRVRFQSCCKQVAADPPAAEALLRIAQEALANVHRHARASAVDVSLVEHRGFVELGVKDDGCGLPPSAGPSVTEGVGLKGMRHRIERLGGTFRIRRMKHGTKVTASLAAARFYSRGHASGRD